jgi:hypothetical protein
MIEDSTGEALLVMLSGMREWDQGRENMIDDHGTVLTCTAVLLEMLCAEVPFQTTFKAATFCKTLQGQGEGRLDTVGSSVICRLECVLSDDGRTKAVGNFGLGTR